MTIRYYADAEVIITAIELVKAFGIEQFKLTIGHAGVLQRILKDYTESDDASRSIKSAISRT